MPHWSPSELNSCLRMNWVLSVWKQSASHLRMRRRRPANAARIGSVSHGKYSWAVKPPAILLLYMNELQTHRHPLPGSSTRPL
jgi:hypothetical protein